MAIQFMSDKTTSPEKRIKFMSDVSSKAGAPVRPKEAPVKFMEEDTEGILPLETGSLIQKGLEEIKPVEFLKSEIQLSKDEVGGGFPGAQTDALAMLKEFASFTYHQGANLFSILESMENKIRGRAEEIGIPSVVEPKILENNSIIKGNISEGLRKLSEAVSPTEEDIRPGVIPAINRAGLGAIPTIAEYTLLGSIMGSNTAAFAFLEALSEADKGTKAAVIGAIKGGSFGQILKGMHLFSNATRSLSMAGVFGGQAAIEGAPFEEVVGAAVTGAGLGVIGRPGPFAISDIVAPQKLQPTIKIGSKKVVGKLGETHEELFDKLSDKEKTFIDKAEERGAEGKYLGFEDSKTGKFIPGDAFLKRGAEFFDRMLKSFEERARKDITKEEAEIARKNKGLVRGTLGDQRGALFSGPKEPKKPLFKWSNKAAEESRSRSFVDKEKPWVTVGRWVDEHIRWLGRARKSVPKTGEFAKADFALTQQEKQLVIQGGNAQARLRDIIERMTPEERNIYGRLIPLEDFIYSASKGHKVPWFRNTKELTETYEETLAEAKKFPRVRQSLDRRNSLIQASAKRLVREAGKVGIDLSEQFKNPVYYRHQVLEHAKKRGIFKPTKGKRGLKKPFRAQQLPRKGSPKPINPDYLEMDYLVLTELLYDAEMYKTFAKVKAAEDISFLLKKKYKDELMKLALSKEFGFTKKSLKARAKERNKKGTISVKFLQNTIEDIAPGILKEKGLTEWKDLRPEGYEEHYFNAGKSTYQTYGINGKKVAELLDGALEEVGVRKEDLTKIHAIGKSKEPIIIKKEVKDLLNEWEEPPAKEGINRKAIKAWKVWSLVGPRRFVKYNVRNMIGDADHVFVGNPKTFLHSRRAMKELYDFMVKGEITSEEFNDWKNFGGPESTMQAQEIGELKKQRKMSDLHEGFESIPAEAWRVYWRSARGATDFRENILRYASYLSYLEQMKKHPKGLPENFGASIPDEIMGLTDIKERAFWLSNDLLGAYDRLTPLGKRLRKGTYPFWSWQEINLKWYPRVVRNAINDNKLMAILGRSFAKNFSTKERATLTAYQALRTGKIVTRAFALLAALQVWNRTAAREEDDKLPIEQRESAHITLPVTDALGQSIAFTRVGAFADFLEWFDLDAPFIRADYKSLLSGRKTLTEVVEEETWTPWHGPIKKTVTGFHPGWKTFFEVVFSRASFPDPLKPSHIRDPWLHIARQFALENEYKVIMQLPREPYINSINDIFVYKFDPLKSAYHDNWHNKNKFLKKLNKQRDGFITSPRGKALYKIKEALRYKDRPAAEAAFKEYISLVVGPNVSPEEITRGEWETIHKGIKTSLIDNMHPLSGLSKEKGEDVAFVEQLSEDDKERLKRALQYYEQVLQLEPTEESIGGIALPPEEKFLDFGGGNIQFLK